MATVGRPLSGQCQEKWVEVTRLCSDGTPNVCSFLYSAAARAAFALGYARIQTYILQDETGASLKGAGWRFDRMSLPSGWHKRGRPLASHLQGLKQLWFQGEASPEKATTGAKPRHPWERVGMGRSTWYRLGKPKRPARRLTQRETARELGTSVRTLQRRALERLAAVPRSGCPVDKAALDFGQGRSGLNIVVVTYIIIYHHQNT